jgi:hypothetical protein
LVYRFKKIFLIKIIFFIYKKGLKGNRNNFLSREHCQQICEYNYNFFPSSLPNIQQQGQINGKWLTKILISKNNFCLRGEPLKNSFDGNLIKCGNKKLKLLLEDNKEEKEECPNTHYCHIGINSNENGCCLKTGKLLLFLLLS